MKRTFFAALLLLSCTALRPVERLEPRSLPKLQLPELTEVKLPNGMTVFFFEDHTLPMVSAEVTVKAGSIYDPVAKKGLTKFVVNFMESGGTKTLLPAEFERQSDALGIQCEVTPTREMIRGELKTLSSHMEKGFSLFLDMMFRPAFHASREDLVRKKLLEDLRREQDEPELLAKRLFLETVYGKDSTWARRPTHATIMDITRQDAIDYHHHYFVPQNTMMAIVGDFNTEAMKEMLIAATADLPRTAPAFPAVSPVEETFSASRVTLEKPLTQAYIRMGHLGIKRTNPDRFALTILNHILGSGDFKSRLMEDIRVTRGLAYGISSDFSPETDYGVFEVRVATKKESADEVIGIIKKHVEEIAAHGVTEAELRFAKRSILNGLIFAFETPRRVAAQQLLYRFYGYPDDYWKTYQAQVKKVTTAEVKRVAQKYLHPDAFKIVVVGPR
ncbi:MAG: insulinase family protein [Deltaproteobacteria bacterium]|nr:insulinase family protein [Deltaproteobacteria bacterium]